MTIDITTEDFKRRFPPHRCKRCRRGLEAHFDDKDGGLLWWEHGYLPDYIVPHEPEPEPADVSDVVAVCDFCMVTLVPGDEWTIPATTFTIRITGQPPYTSCEDWAGCDDCIKLYNARDWPNLVDRYMRITKLAVPRDRAYELLTGAWLGLVAHQNGEPFRGRPLHAEDGQHRG